MVASEVFNKSQGWMLGVNRLTAASRFVVIFSPFVCRVLVIFPMGFWNNGCMASVPLLQNKSCWLQLNNSC